MQQIKKLFGHKLIGNAYMKRMVIKTLIFFPQNIINHVTQKVWFISSMEDSWAFAIRGDELKKDEHLVFLSDELLNENEKQITWTIAHEIGHVILGHRNSIGIRQTKYGIAKQEKEADKFASKYLEE